MRDIYFKDIITNLKKAEKMNREAADAMSSAYVNYYKCEDEEEYINLVMRASMKNLAAQEQIEFITALVEGYRKEEVRGEA